MFDAGLLLIIDALETQGFFSVDFQTGKYLKSKRQLITDRTPKAFFSRSRFGISECSQFIIAVFQTNRNNIYQALKNFSDLVSQNFL